MNSTTEPTYATKVTWPDVGSSRLVIATPWILFQKTARGGQPPGFKNVSCPTVTSENKAADSCRPLQLSRTIEDSLLVQLVQGAQLYRDAEAPPLLRDVDGAFNNATLYQPIVVDWEYVFGPVSMCLANCVSAARLPTSVACSETAIS